MKTPTVLQKSHLWSLLENLNSELKDKQYLIEVNSANVLMIQIVLLLFFPSYLSPMPCSRNLTISHQQIYLFG